MACRILALAAWHPTPEGQIAWPKDLGFAYKEILLYLHISSLCAFCRVVVPTQPFTNTALYYKMLLESEPTPPATFFFVFFDGGSKANVGHYKMVTQTGCSKKS